jgi:hypothetical protein
MSRDDLALVPIDGYGIEQSTAPPPHQEGRASSADGIAPPSTWRRIAFVVGKLRESEDLAPGLPRHGTFTSVLGHEKGNDKRRIAVKQNECSPLGGIAHSDADEFADADADCHFHAAHRAVQRDALAMKFNLPDAAVGAAVTRGEADRQ